MTHEVLVVLGTRPEAVKLRPVLEHARVHRDWTVRVCVTGQHPAALVRAAGGETGGTEALDPPASGASSRAVRDHIEEQLRRRFASRAPAVVVGQGDTTSVLATARAAAASDIRFVHVEAGLRTFDRAHPFPEEDIRVEVSALATLHLAPTWRAFEHLRCEGVAAEAIIVTGNTSVDAVRQQLRTLAPRHRAPASVPEAIAARLRRTRGWILVTHHRRESLPTGLRAVRDAVARVAATYPELSVIWPVHPNPRIVAELEALEQVPNVCRVPPLAHEALLWLLRGASLVITDSGGIQEEAPEFGVPVLVTRRRTERMEAVEQGAATLVGHDEARIVAAAQRVLAGAVPPGRTGGQMPRRNPFGDGAASIRCVAALRWLIGLPGAQRPRSWRPDPSAAPRQTGATVRRADDRACRILPSRR